ncbi:ABC-three component system protein [Polaromonas naphthalenivorans]|uniref:ABC-three component systems C-terminal domain-containing protein n=1 Tax=Polaromonas naphthalenivorans (strain CJ2) TaxID=365044 RepID=A1VWC9_POLNA|nr:ABC-three component system protein [Polaromonas naphthalenivorans]ABM39957.1 conserved hypothetical protein [Polaromonas naphthalenivorans CJ2]
MATSTTKVRKTRKNQLVVRQGAMPPAAQVMHFSPDEWEKFIEAACFLRPLRGQTHYVQVKQLGGAGDGGRDIEARLIQPLQQDGWDLFQAKHYDHGLTPGDAFPELAKFFKHLSFGTYPQPKHYYFCSPKNAGVTLHDLLATPVRMKEQFLREWAAGDKGLKAAELTPAVTAVVSAFDFSRIRECLVRDLLAWHALDQGLHFERFGIETERGADPTMPGAPGVHEQVYIEQLIRVYSEHSATPMTLADVEAALAYADDFESQRAAFYCAEGLKRFSRDLYTEDEFDRLLAMVLSGIKPSVNSVALKTGMDRLTVALNTVSKLGVTDSKLSTRLRGGDLPGTCHHLVNENKMKWLK